MGLEPPQAARAVVDEWQQQRMPQRREPVALRRPRPYFGDRRVRIDEQAHALARRQIQRVARPAFEREESVRYQRHGDRESALQDADRADAPPGTRKNFVYNFQRMLRFLTAGESHGRALVVILEGLPAGLPVDVDAIARDLRRRQGGYGRGRRMAIESDRADILSGVRAGETLGGPIAMSIENRDWVNWQHTMRKTVDPPPDAGGARRAPVTRPRPGHADLAGVAKYGRADVRDILERASARETAARVAAGAVARQLLGRAGIRITSHVFSIGQAAIPGSTVVTFEAAAALSPDAPLRCVDPEVERRMIDEIDRAREAGDTKGGAFEVIATGVPVGLGSYVQWDRKLDGRLAHAMMSIPAIKAVGIGLGPEAAARPGSDRKS